MKKLIALTALAFALVPVAADAATTKVVPTTYTCTVCHMKYTAAQAKADHYKDSMDGGKLVPVAPAKPTKPALSSSSMSGMKM